MDPTATNNKPKLRGVLHMIAFPVSLVTGLVLVVASKGDTAKISCAIYSVAISALFGVSALYHRGHWRSGPSRLLQRIDHADIYLAIAGSYTPLCLLALHGVTSRVVLAVVWSGAAFGVILSMFWPKAPRVVLVPTYLVVGWTAAVVIPEMVKGGGVALTVLVLVGGLFYTAGGVIYALKRPNPSPRVFGFHEVFHSCTIFGWITQYIAISLIAYRF